MTASPIPNPTELPEVESDLIPFPNRDDGDSAQSSDEPTPMPFPVRYEHKGRTCYLTISATSWLDTLSRIKAIKRTLRLNLQ